MAAETVDGSLLSKQLLQTTKEGVQKLPKGKHPFLAVILIGDNPASVSYVNMKQQACLGCQIGCEIFKFDFLVSEKDVLQKVFELNLREDVNGILIQLPLPEHLDRQKILNAVSPEKDVDGLTTLNQGKLVTGEVCLVSATALACIKILKNYIIPLKGKKCVIVNDSTLIGKPLVNLLLSEKATVEICNKYTNNLENETKQADVLISATGVSNLIKAGHMKPGCIAIDAGFSKRNGKIYGDFNKEDALKKAALYTQVPGGVGPVTVAVVAENTLKAYKLQNNIQEEF